MGGAVFRVDCDPLRTKARPARLVAVLAAVRDPQTKIRSAPAGAEDRGQHASVDRSAIGTDCRKAMLATHSELILNLSVDDPVLRPRGLGGVHPRSPVPVRRVAARGYAALASAFHGDGLRVSCW